MDKKTDRKSAKSAFAMATQYLLALVILAAVRVAIPTQAFADLPPIVAACLETLPIWIVAAICLNLSLPKGSIRFAGYAPALLLLVPAAFVYQAATEALAAFYPTITAQMDIWAWQAIGLYATRPFALGVLLLVLFLLIWKVAFSIGRGHNARYLRLLRPWTWLLLALGCILVAYLHMVDYAQINMGPVFGTLFAKGPPESAWWYHMGPVVALVAHWAAGPLETLLMGCFVLQGMLVFRRSVCTA